MSPDPARPYATMGTRIRKRRQALGWKQSDLAERVGVHVNSVQKWEKGEQYPERHAGRIEEVLGITLDGEPEPPPPIPPELLASVRRTLPPGDQARVLDAIARTLSGEPQPPTGPGEAAGSSGPQRQAG